MFEKYNLTADELAKRVAEWMLFMKKRRTVDFSTTPDDLSAFRQYFLTNERLRKRAG
jgi:hypothetical protein